MAVSDDVTAQKNVHNCYIWGGYCPWCSPPPSCPGCGRPYTPWAPYYPWKRHPQYPPYYPYIWSGQTTVGDHTGYTVTNHSAAASAPTYQIYDMKTY